jgi:hypothetical protein
MKREKRTPKPKRGPKPKRQPTRPCECDGCSFCGELKPAEFYSPDETPPLYARLQWGTWICLDCFRSMRPNVARSDIDAIVWNHEQREGLT